MKFLPSLKIAQKLLLVVIGAAMLVAIGVGATAYLSGLQIVDEQRQERMDAAVQAGLEQVKSYFDNVSADLRLSAAQPQTATQIEAMTQAFEALNAQGHATEALQRAYIGGDPKPTGQKLTDSAGTGPGDYDTQHKQVDPAWRALLQARSYADILLFNANDVLIYSVKKNPDFAVDFSRGSGSPLSEGDVARLVDRTAQMQAGEVAFSDFTFYKPAPQPMSFIATPVYSAEKFVGVLVFELSAKSISDKLSAIRGLGHTGDEIIVSSDGLMRTQSHFTTDPNVLVTPIRGDVVTAALGGQHAQGTLSYRGTPMVALAAPFSYDKTNWAVIAVQSRNEILAPVLAMLDTMLLVGGALLVLVAAVGVLFARSVSKPVARLAGTMKVLAGGDFNVQVSGAGRSDDIGEIARGIEDLRTSLIKATSMTEEERAGSERGRVERAAMLQALQAAFGDVADAAVAGDFSRRVDAEFPDREFNTIAASINTLVETVERGLRETSGVLSALADTDLSRRVEGNYRGAFALLKDDTNAVAEKLAQIVGRLKDTSRTLKTATAEILSGANDLSERTSRQAATIEETSATMEQLSGTVLQNAQRANEALLVAAAVTRTAEEGGEVMLKATDAMERITHSSGKISNIIGLIDDIAFQTNLLALNASVEAARAGEAGKGFAVVAVEVRRLAQSAAQASAEVKGLIEQSGAEVKTGSKFVAEAAQKLDAMLAAARSSNELMDSIAKQSQDQAASIGEVNAAVRQMDEMTQRNAALVEETNASIEQTEKQAIELDEIVAVFATGGAVPPRAQAARQSPSAQPKPPQGIKALQEKVKTAARSYLNHGNAAVDKDWQEF